MREGLTRYLSMYLGHFGREWREYFFLIYDVSCFKEISKYEGEEFGVTRATTLNIIFSVIWYLMSLW